MTSHGPCCYRWQLPLRARATFPRDLLSTLAGPTTLGRKTRGRSTGDLGRVYAARDPHEPPTAQGPTNPQQTVRCTQ